MLKRKISIKIKCYNVDETTKYNTFQFYHLGHVDPGEKDYETALRETKEEAGLDQSSFTVISNFSCELNYKVTSHRDGIERPKIVTYWCAELNDYNCPVIMSDEHQAFNWLPLEQAKKLSGFKDMNECFDKCEAKINSL